MPTPRPSMRWAYSIRKMRLNSARDIPRLTSRYSGDARYASNSRRHASSPIGGRTPETGCHLTMDSPEPVSRVTPPTTTIAYTSAAHAISHHPTARGGTRHAGGWASIDVAGSFTAIRRDTRDVMKTIS